MVIFSLCLFHLYSHCGRRHFKNCLLFPFYTHGKKEIEARRLIQELTVTRSRCNCQRPPTTSHLSPPALAALRGRLRTKVAGMARRTGRKSDKPTNIRVLIHTWLWGYGPARAFWSTPCPSWPPHLSFHRSF